MDNKTIAKLLRKAIKDSQYQSNRYGKMNGFEIIVGEETKVSPDKLVAKVVAIADILDEVQEESGDNMLLSKKGKL